MPDEEWIKTLEDGRKVKFVYQELPGDGAFITAQLAGNEVVYSIVIDKAGNPLSHEAVESRFKEDRGSIGRNDDGDLHSAFPNSCDNPLSMLRETKRAL